MEKPVCRAVGLLAVILAAGAIGCSSPPPKNETVARVNGDPIKVVELREFLGVYGGMTAAAGVSSERKKEALDRLIAGRLLAQEARARGLDNTDEFRKAVRESEQTALVTALLRKKIASAGKIPLEEIEAERKKMQAADNTASDNNALLRAQRALAEAKMRKIQEELIAEAEKEFPSRIHEETVDRIGKGEPLPDDAVLATAAGDNVTYGMVKSRLQRIAGAHGGSDIARSPAVIRRVLKREVAGRSLVAYAKREKIGESDWMKDVREDIERSVLLDLLAGRVLGEESGVTDKEIEDFYRERPEMFVQQGKKLPLKAVREQLRGFLRSEKRKNIMLSLVEELRKKAEITVDKKVLGAV